MIKRFLKFTGISLLASVPMYCFGYLLGSSVVEAVDTSIVWDPWGNNQFYGLIVISILLGLFLTLMHGLWERFGH